MILTPITNPVALRLDTTVGTRIFAGTTMIYGNTGWRQLYSSTNQPAWGTISSGNSIQVRRDGNQVFLKISGYTGGADDGIRKIFTLPSGFRPSQSLLSETITNRDFAANRMELDLSTNGEISVVKYQTSGRCYGSITFITGDAWPVVLP